MQREQRTLLRRSWHVQVAVHLQRSCAETGAHARHAFAYTSGALLANHSHDFMQNVLLTEHGRAKVADVGLARMVPATQSCLSGNGGCRGLGPGSPCQPTSMMVPHAGNFPMVVSF